MNGRVAAMNVFSLRRQCCFTAMIGHRFVLVALALAFSPLALTTSATPAAAAAACIFDWAVPGLYHVSANFRGHTEAVTARLTTDCRVTIGLPGVFTGGRVTRAGSCLQFSFRVEGERQTFTARWCDSYGVVPWQGRNVRATIVPRQSLMERHNR